MIAQRVGVAAMRRAAFSQNMPRLAMAARISTTQARPIETTTLSPTQGQDILAKQRLLRPIAPHLGIYKRAQTWFSPSAWTRITGCTLSGAAYAYFITYLIAPLAGFHVESQSLVAGFAALPFAVQGLVKIGLGFPFVFHFINGIRHLSFDVLKGFTKTQIRTGERAILGASLLGTLYLAFGL
ncbi:succinate dehydrogenase cytochrome b560 subunit [Cordyceps militaris CM01]|uniref:Succinate dehydrogenase cytochrome b560 subunit n=2 Tax=Cordyceps militaris TaxID=73501 RepID=G3JTU8_CORMM|nr:succinate dehydrogenase cytochrome b560 subunit [Cordyceps militaris CM01]ATY67092.1 succinate dehydrogenase cytochrome b560 subunit [Cordyceps militaris]EGX88102.1 succinate dehydrogenase cytochrome b560 subunit [Cordyceps militaris CM01]